MKVARRRDPKIDIPIVNIGDIAFLLIIFFILTSAFMRETYIKYTPAESADIKRLKDPPVTVTVDRQGNIWLQGVSCQFENLEPGVTAVLEGQPNRTVMLKVDKDLPQVKYGPVILAISKAGAEIALVGNEKK